LDQTAPNAAAPYRHSLALRAAAGGALNTETMTMSVTDLATRGVTLAITGFGHQPLSTSAAVVTALVGFDLCCLLVC